MLQCTSLNSRNGVLIVNGAPETTAAHEIQHTIGEGHSPGSWGNMAQDGWWVRKALPRISAARDTYDGTGDGLTYNFYSHMRPSYVIPGTSSEVIPSWAASDDYDHLLGEFDDPADFNLNQMESVTIQSVSPLLLVIGMFLPDNTVELIPWQILEEGTPTPSTSGKYSIQCLSISGTVLNQVNFDSLPLSEQVPGEEIYLFSVVVEFPHDTYKVSIRHDSAILKEIPVSPSIPTVTITSPNGGELWDGIKEIRWEGSDPDGDGLYYTILYSHNSGMDWVPLAADLTTTTFFLDTTALPGGTNSLIKIIVTDGINSAHDISDGFFSVPTKAPSTYISLPVDGSAYTKGNIVAFSGTGFDPEDGVLDDSSLTWISSIDGTIGTGSYLTTSALSLGNHQITFEVTDSEGQTVSSTVKISITTATQPDLSIYDINFTPEKPRVVNGEAEEVTITANILNIITAAICDVSFYINGALIDTQQVVALANSLTRVQTNWIPSGRGSYDISVVISNSDPIESDLTNNEAHRVLIMNQPPIANANGPYEDKTNEVLLDVDPNTLNLSSHSRWITAYIIEDPDGTIEIQLDGSGSYDPDGDEIIYRWTVTDLNGNIVATANGINPVVTLGAGGYEVRLVVNDGQIDSEPATSTTNVYLLDVSTLDPTTLYLNGIQGEWGESQEPELMIKFDRELVSKTLKIGDEVEIVISGDAIAEASNFIRVIDRGSRKNKE